jgi:hypothetical protein
MSGDVSRRTGTMIDVGRPTDYERKDAEPRLIGALAAGVAVFLAATPFGLGVVFPGAQTAGRVPPELRLPPQPRLQTHPGHELARLRGRERRELNTYGWVDRDGGVVRIPIDRAMQLMVERGWPAASPQLSGR